MAKHYSAYGLHLICAFALPGSEPAAADGDRNTPGALEIERTTPASLAHDWHGADGPAEWRGLLGDGLELAIERGVDGEILFRYGEEACFRLHSDMRRLDCAPSRDGLDWQRVLISKVIPAISVMRGYEALHAAGVSSPEGVVAIMAPSGTGKSTLAVELLSRGWDLFTDDVLILSSGEDGVLAHPGSPHMNLAEAHATSSDDPQPRATAAVSAPAESPDTPAPASLGDTLAILAGERWLAVRNTATQPLPVRMLCLLERRDELTGQAHPLAGSPLPLAPYMLGLPGDATRERSRFSLFADLTATTPLVRLTSGLRDTPEMLADLLEQALEEHVAVGSGRLA